VKPTEYVKYEKKFFCSSLISYKVLILITVPISLGKSHKIMPRLRFTITYLGFSHGEESEVACAHVNLNELQLSLQALAVLSLVYLSWTTCRHQDFSTARVWGYDCIGGDASRKLTVQCLNMYDWA
jgi:hypothetical protein